MPTNNLGIIDRSASSAFFRASRGRLSRTTAADLAGVSKAALFQWERGAIPSIEAFVSWCRAVNANPAEALAELLAASEHPVSAASPRDMRGA